MSQTKINVGMIDASSIGDAKVLQGNGAWVTPSAGALTFISNTDISAAATYNFTAFTAGSYEHYQFVLQNVIPVTDSAHFWVRTSTDGGSSYDAGSSDYSWGGICFNGSYDTDGGDNQISLTGNDVGTDAKVGSASLESGVNGTIWLHGPHTTSYTGVTSLINYVTADGVPASSIVNGHRISAADVDGFQILFQSGNIESGTITVYGLANS